MPYHQSLHLSYCYFCSRFTNILHCETLENNSFLFFGGGGGTDSTSWPSILFIYISLRTR